jgi:hypothetical protein
VSSCLLSNNNNNNINNATAFAWQLPGFCPVRIRISLLLRVVAQSFSPYNNKNCLRRNELTKAAKDTDFLFAQQVFVVLVFVVVVVGEQTVVATHTCCQNCSSERLV